MQRIAADVWHGVCVSVTKWHSAKTAGPIKMPFGTWAQVGPCNHVLDGGPDPPWEGAIFGVSNRLHLALPAMHDAANSADHNHSLIRRIAADGMAWSMCFSVCT